MSTISSTIARTPNGGTIDYTYEWENASSYTCGCTFLAVADRSVNDGAQTATWTLDSDFLAFQHYTRVNNPDGTRLTYLFEKKDGGNFFKTVVPDSRVLVRLSTVKRMPSCSQSRPRRQRGGQQHGQVVSSS